MQNRILVVEDSPLIRRLIRITLRDLAVAIDEAPDGPSGAALADSSHDLIILDIGLPGLDGWSVLEKIRAEPATAGVPVLVVTAHAQESMRRRAQDQGADAFLTKPFAPKVMVGEVCRLLGIVDERSKTGPPPPASDGATWDGLRAVSPSN